MELDQSTSPRGMGIETGHPSEVLKGATHLYVHVAVDVLETLSDFTVGAGVTVLEALATLLKN